MPNNWNCLVPLTPLLEKLTHRLSRYSFESGGWSGSSAISLSLPSWIRVRLSFCFWTYQVKSLIALLTHCRSWISDWVGSLMGFFISLMWFCVTMVLEYFFFLLLFIPFCSQHSQENVAQHSSFLDFALYRIGAGKTLALFFKLK